MGPGVRVPHVPGVGRLLADLSAAVAWAVMGLRAWMLCILTLPAQGPQQLEAAVPQGRSTHQWVTLAASEWFSVHRIIYFSCQGGPGQLSPLAMNALSIIDSSGPTPGNLPEQQVCVWDS